MRLSDRRAFGRQQQAAKEKTRAVELQEEALQRVGAYYRLRASYGVSASRAQDGMSPETEPQRQQVRDFYAQHASGPAVGEL